MSDSPSVQMIPAPQVNALLLESVAQGAFAAIGAVGGDVGLGAEAAFGLVRLALRAAEARGDAAEAKLAEAEAKISTLEARVATLEEHLDDAQAQNDILLTEIPVIKGRLAALETQEDGGCGCKCVPCEHSPLGASTAGDAIETPAPEEDPTPSLPLPLDGEPAPAA